MKSILTQILPWEDLQQLHISDDDIAVRASPVNAVHWTNGPPLLKHTIRKFLFLASNKCLTHADWYKYEINIIKWYLGQWLAGMWYFPPKWDEELNKVEGIHSLIRFVMLLLAYGIDPF